MADRKTDIDPTGDFTGTVLRIGMSPEEFAPKRDEFISDLAKLLAIDESEIRITEVSDEPIQPTQKPIKPPKL